MTPAHRLLKRKDGTETLERIKRWPTLADKFNGKFVFIRSDQWGAFWGPNNSGYTDDKQKAGIYSFNDAFNATRHCGSEKGISFVVATAEYNI